MNFIDYALFIKFLLIVVVIYIFPYRGENWNVYMEEIGGFLDGELNYSKLKSNNVSLNSPGGFVWLYSALYYITKAGASISLAQIIFSYVYLITFGMVLSLYRQAEFPSWVSTLLFVSPRILSTYSLSLSNDCWGMFFLYGAITLIAGRRYWKLGCLLYSMAVSVKSSLLLVGPGLLYVLFRSLSFFKVLYCLAVCVLWQLVVGYPFIFDDWRSYVGKVFALRSIFIFDCPENDQLFEKILCTTPYRTHVFLAIVVVSWLLLWRLRWSTRWRITVDDEKKEGEKNDIFHEKDSCRSHMIVLTLFESNFAGLLVESIFHCGLYTSFFHMLPYILYSTEYPIWLSSVVLGLIIQGFEIFPPTHGHSILMMTGIISLILGILFFGTNNNIRRAHKKGAAKIIEEEYDSNNFSLPSSSKV
ncbi:unnamed protein product [Phytomonas sp. Hart1]|nr:unnamed protein product [Phytomonas sp. Hart1]|eukprot:CCW66961.1 unnamed protein product [Phytomonas sp. isolate Hart1]